MILGKNDTRIVNVLIANDVYFHAYKNLGYVQIFFRSTHGGTTKGANMIVNDFRLATIGSIRHNGVGDGKLKKVLNAPARVFVRRVNEETGTCVLNLHDLAPEEQADGLLSVTRHHGSHKAQVAIKEDKSLFSWQSISSNQKVVRKEEIFLLAITDAGHPMAVYRSGFANVKEKREPQVFLLAESIREIPAVKYIKQERNCAEGCAA